VCVGAGVADKKNYLMFKIVWRTTNELLVLCLAGHGVRGGWEYSVYGQYLNGFSDATASRSGVELLKFRNAYRPRVPQKLPVIRCKS